jgi:hypothetical protein
VVYNIVTRILLAWSTRDPLEEFIDGVMELELSIKKAVAKSRGRNEDINIQAGELTWVMFQAGLSVLGKELRRFLLSPKKSTEYLLNKTNKRGRLQLLTAQPPKTTLSNERRGVSCTRTLQPGILQASVDFNPCCQGRIC